MLVVNRRRVKMKDGDLYIGRGSPWGNPFVIGLHGNREQVIERYRIWIAERPHLIDKLISYDPKRLLCYCAPLACHGDVLVELVEERMNE